MAGQKKKKLENSSTEKTPTTNENEISDSENEHPITETIDKFINCIEGYRAYAPIMSVVLSEIAKERFKDFEKMADKFGEGANENNKFYFPVTEASKAQKIIDELDQLTAARETFPSMILLPLVSQYDAFIADLLKVLFQKRPGLIFTSDKKISFSEIAEFNSIEDIKNSIVELEVEKIIRDSHSAQFDTMEKIFDVKLKEGLDIWPDFIEITERRNLLAHTNGVVSKQYISICKKHDVPEEKIPKIGERLSFTSEYFTHAFNVFYEISLKLAHVLWRHKFPEEIEQSDDHYNNQCIELISAKNFKVAIKLLDFICDVVNQHSNDNIRLYMQFNRCNAHRLTGQQKRCIELLDEIDTTALGIEFKLAEAVLRSKFEDASKIMRQIGDSHKIINQMSYSDWPLFEGFRESTQFLKAYEEIFNKPFTVETSLNTNEIIRGNAASSNNK